MTRDVAVVKIWPLLAAHWRDDAACRDMPPEMFYGERGDSTREAKAVCRSCSVVDECLDYAVTTGEKFGIWGGKSERERKVLRRLRDRTSVVSNHGTSARYKYGCRCGLCRGAASREGKAARRTIGAWPPAGRISRSDRQAW